MLTTPSAASDTKINGLWTALGSMKLAVVTGSCEIRVMVGGSRLLSVRPVDAICRCTDCPPTLGPPGENSAGELPPEQPPSIASVADAPSAARIVRKIGIKSDYHFYSLWSAPRKVSIIQLVKHSHNRARDDVVAAGTIRSTRVENEASAEETKVLRVASNGDLTAAILAVPGIRHNRGNP